MPDSVRHRVWQCLHPESVAARKSVTDDAPVEWLAEALESEDRLFVDEMKWEHPESSYPPLSSATQPILYSPEGEIIEWGSVDLSGCDVVMDGSAFRHTVRELSRAAFSWVFLGEGDTIIAYAKGTVLSVLPQTSQAAEHLRVALLPMFQSNGGDRHSDCMNVVRICVASREYQVFHKHRYAGLRRGALLHETNPSHQCTTLLRIALVLSWTPCPQERYVSV